MITVNNLAMQFGAKLLFTEVNLNFNANFRYGLVGANGAGKTTLLKVLGGEESPSLGEINLAKNARIGWLKQDQFKYEHVSIINTVIAGKEQLWLGLCEKEQILAKDEISEQDGYKLGEIEQIIFDHDGYNADILAAKLLVGLGIKEEQHHSPLSVLSGGYKLRVLLAQSLFDNPDILLLDEPTNHLDISSIYWLENYLKEEFTGVLIFISHDVAFLNNLATHILDIDYGEVRAYTGNYLNFLIEKKQIAELKIKERANVAKKIEHMKSFVERFGAKASKATQAQSRIKQIEKIELPDIQNSSRISPNFNFKTKRSSGKIVLKVDDIYKSYGATQVLKKVSFTITNGEKTIIIGPNGIGKSTLLKIVLGSIAADCGNFEWGYETHIAYFAQDHHEMLHESISAFEWLQRELPSELPNKIRSVMGQVLFKQGSALANILSLSGGEGARLLLAKIMLAEPNVLVLDEPTNHLDIEAKEALKNAIINHAGSLLMVTHDRDFASLATRIIAISAKGITDFKGSYSEYLKKYGMDYLKRA